MTSDRDGDRPSDAAHRPGAVAAAVGSGGWFLRGMVAAFTGTTVVPILNYVAFGTLAREAGFALPETIVVAAGVWWVSGQVVLTMGFAHNMMLAPTALSVWLSAIPLLPMVMSVVPLFGTRGRGWLRRLVDFPLAQAVATVPWLIAQRRLPDIAPAMRPLFFSGYALCFMSICVGAAVIAYEFSTGLPPLVRSLLVFVLPLHLLFGVMGSARDGMVWLAILFGVLLGPLLEPQLRDFAVMTAGLVGGTVAFALSRAWRARMKRDAA